MFKMKTIFVVLAVLSAAVTYTSAQCEYTPTTASGTHAPPGPYCKDQLLFEENFDGFDQNLWLHEITMNGGGNGEFQWYVNDPVNSFVQNGHLYLKPSLTTDYLPDLYNCHIFLEDCTTDDGCEHYCGNDNIAPPIRSAKVRTVTSFAFKYGKAIVRAKMPTGDWLWPALWFMPKNSVYGTWPRSGEIDLCESRGNLYLFNDQGQNTGVEEFGSTLHFGTEWYNSAWWSSTFSTQSPPGQGWNTDFHDYEVEWGPSGFIFRVDGRFHGEIPVGTGFFDRGFFEGTNIWAQGELMAPFDQEFYFIFNTAIGGTNWFFPDEGNASGKPWQNGAGNQKLDFWNGRDQWYDSWNLNNSNDAALQIDRVRVYAY